MNTVTIRKVHPGDEHILAHIHSLQPNWGRGYGSMLMERILADVSAAGYTCIMLWVFEQNLRAINFYKKHGFVPSDRKKDTHGAGEVMYVRENR